MRTARNILVIGGTSATGRAIVGLLAARGCRVAFNGRNVEAGDAIAQATGAHFLAGDYLGPGAPEHIVGHAVSTLGALDGLVLAGGLLHVARISETTDTAWNAVIENNLVAPFRIARAAMWELAKDGGGAIVTVASGTALRTEMELGAYSVAKRSVLWMTNMLAVEGGPKGITANTVCPGDMPGGMTSVAHEPQLRDLGGPAIPPSGRLTVPEDTARAVAFLLDAGPAVTGAALVVDGGMRAALRSHRVHQP